MSKKVTIWSSEPVVKKAVIKALDNAEITYRELTLHESDNLTIGLMDMNKLDAQGQPTVDVVKASRMKYEKVAMMVVEPAVTVEELYALPASKRGAIDEILALAGDEDEAVDTEGN